MGREDFEQIGTKGIVKRKSKRIMGLFIDGVGLDRATRRLDRKVDLGRLVKGVTTGLKLEVSKYYTLIPNEDDARQFAFLDAVERAGLEVVVKRLPPIGVKRQVSVDVHMAADIVAFSHGHFEKDEEPSTTTSSTALPIESAAKEITAEPVSDIITAPKSAVIPVKRSALVVCPSRELSYAIYLANQVGVETSLADFGLYGTSDGWRGVDRWIDLSTSETIWR